MKIYFPYIGISIMYTGNNVHIPCYTHYTEKCRCFQGLSIQWFLPFLLQTFISLIFLVKQRLFLWNNDE